MKAAAFTFLFLLTSAPLFAEDTTKTWQGTWRNQRFGTNGTLRCVASSKDGTTWTAKFDGLFRRRQFNYNVTFTGKKGRGKTDLAGTATIDGDRYQWAGYIRGNTLYGRFRSNKGYFGDFTLREAAKRRRR